MIEIRRTPLYFGDESRPLFGWLHRPSGLARDLAVVICPPLGHEYVNSHRSMRHLADAFAAAGLPALRFDYDGCGDSPGGDEDPERANAWRRSVVHALRAAREHTGSSRVSVVGLRMGATLASLASLDANDESIESLVLWAPCVRGRGYVRELKTLALTGSNRNAKSESGVIEPGGFVFTNETQEAIGCIDLGGAVPKARRILVMARDDMPADNRLCDAWRAAGACVDQRAFGGYAAMMDEPHRTQVPHEAIREIVGWVVADAGERIVQLPPRDGRDAFLCARYRESIVHVRDAAHPFFGVLCEPAGGSVGPLILLANAGATHHVGPNRLYVLIARALAERGFRSLRLDLPGLGDNPTDDPAEENQPYLPSASSVIATAIAAMKARRAADRFVLMGLCSGAHAAFHAGLDLDDPSIAECVLLNPLTFYYKSGASLDHDEDHYGQWQRYMRSMRSLSGWAKLFRDDVKLSAIARNVALRLRDIVLNKLGSRPGTDDLDADVRRIAERNRRLTFVFSRFDPGYDLLMINGGRAVRALSARDAVRVWRIDDANHTFEAKHSRDRMIASLASHFESVYSQ